MADTYAGIYSEMKAIAASLKGVTGSHFNAVLTFKTFSGNITQDEYGNWTTDASEDVIVNVKLQPDKDPKLTMNPGVDENRQYMIGNLVEPAELNGSFHKYVDCVLTQNNVTVEGKFTFTDHVTDPLDESFDLAVALGQEIKGYFERNQGNI